MPTDDYPTVHSDGSDTDWIKVPTDVSDNEDDPASLPTPHYPTVHSDKSDTGFMMVPTNDSDHEDDPASTPAHDIVAQRPHSTSLVSASSHLSTAASGGAGQGGEALSTFAFKDKGSFLDLSDLLHPTSLKGKTLGKDYVLLCHKPEAGTFDTIQSTGLKSLAQLASEPEATESSKERFTYRSRQAATVFGNDVRNIYSRPIASASSQHRVWRNSIVVAAHPSSVNVFHQEYRANSENRHRGYYENRYKDSSHNISNYQEKLDQLPPGFFLNSCGYPTPATSSGERFDPEAVIRTGTILPEWFVKYSDIDDSVKGKPCLWEGVGGGERVGRPGD